MLRPLANQQISVLAFVVDDLLVPLSRLDCRGRFLVLGQHYAKSSWAHLTNSFLSSALTLSKTARKGQTFSGMGCWDSINAEPVPNAETLLHTCGAARPHEYLITTSCKESNINPALARTSLLHCTISAKPPDCCTACCS